MHQVTSVIGATGFPTPRPGSGLARVSPAPDRPVFIPVVCDAVARVSETNLT